MTLVYGGVRKACTWILRAGMNGFTREGGGGGASETKVRNIKAPLPLQDVDGRQCSLHRFQNLIMEAVTSLNNIIRFISNQHEHGKKLNEIIPVWLLLFSVFCDHA